MLGAIRTWRYLNRQAYTAERVQTINPASKFKLNLLSRADQSDIASRERFYQISRRVDSYFKIS
jgi:hypothetical protein